MSATSSTYFFHILMLYIPHLTKDALLRSLGEFVRPHSTHHIETLHIANQQHHKAHLNLYHKSIPTILYTTTI